MTFLFDRQGSRARDSGVAWAGVACPRWEKRKGRIFEHASIPATVTNHFIPGYKGRTLREENAETFLDLLGDTMMVTMIVLHFRRGA